MQRKAAEFKGESHGWSACSIIPLLVMSMFVATRSQADVAMINNAQSGWFDRVLFALGTMFIAQALIPLIKSWYQTRKFHSTYRSYLLAHVTNTLEHFEGVGSTEFSQIRHSGPPHSDWLRFLEENNLEAPEIFIRVETVINRALADDEYIPSVSYLGLEGNSLDPVRFDA